MIGGILFIIPIILFFILGLCSLFSNNLKFMMLGIMISCICLPSIDYFNNTVTIDKLTVCQNGNIEITGKNSFGDIKTERCSFSEYKVKKSNKNVCFMYDGAEVELTPKYYEQYKNTINTEKSINIKIDE